MPVFSKATKEDNELAFLELEATIQRRKEFERTTLQDPMSPYALHPTTINYTDIQGYSLLHYATALGDLAKVQELVLQHADVNLENPMGNLSIINTALAYGHTHIAQYLYEQGADFNEVEPSLCREPSSRAWLKEKIMEVRNQVMTSDRHFKKDYIPTDKQIQFFKPTQFMLQLARRAVEIGDIEFLQELSMQDPKLFTSLLKEGDLEYEKTKNIYVRAAENGQLDMIKFLLDKKSITTTNDFTTTPLITAIQYNYQEIIDYLITLGIDLHHKDNMKMSALEYAVMADNRKTTFQLLEGGAKCDQVNCNGSTILHLAVFSRSSLIKDLLERPEVKALLYTKNIYGYTPIDLALWSDDKALIELIVPLADREILKPKATNMNQGLILERMYYYLLSQNRDTTFMPKPDGHCNGLAFINLFYSARGMEDYFFKTLALMASWNGDERVLDTPFVSKEQIAYGYKNLRELFEQWINDVIWFQHAALGETGLSRMTQAEHLAHYQFIGIPEQYNAELICATHDRVTTNQLSERVQYFSRMPAKTQIIFSGGGHATSAFIDDKKGLHYYDPNFYYQSATQYNPDLITQQIIDGKYIALHEFANKMDMQIQVYCPKESKETLNKLEILSEEEIPKSTEEALLFQSNSANQWSPLHIAVVTHSLDTFKRLVTDNFCDINAPDAFQLTPLKIAIKNNFIEAIQFALQALEEKPYTDLSDLLEWAYSLNQKEVLNIILAHPSLFKNITQLLIAAVFKRDADFAEKLTTLYPNKIDATELNMCYGTFTLSHAAILGSVKLVKSLLDHGASLFIAANGYKTPLKDIVSSGSRKKKNKEIIDTILTNHNVNQADALGSAAIHYAIESSCIETLQQVIKIGGDIQLRTTEGRSIWDILHNLRSGRNNQEEITLIRNLLISSYKFNLLDQSDNKAMHTLLTSPLKDGEIKTLFELLLKQCSSEFLNQAVRQDSVPFLVYFIREKQYNKIEPLLKKGADVNCRCEHGNTLLMDLILSDAKLIPEKYELIRSVLSYQPDLETLKNHNDETVLDIVRRSTDEKITDLFKDYLEPHAGLFL